MLGRITGTISEAFRQTLREAGVRAIRTPARAPSCNAVAERFVGSFRREIEHRLIFFGAASLDRALREYVAGHYRHERNHQGLGNELIEPEPRVDAVAETNRHHELLADALESLIVREMKLATNGAGGPNAATIPQLATALREMQPLKRLVLGMPPPSIEDAVKLHAAAQSCGVRRVIFMCVTPEEAAAGRDTAAAASREHHEGLVPSCNVAAGENRPLPARGSR